MKKYLLLILFAVGALAQKERDSLITNKTSPAGIEFADQNPSAKVGDLGFGAWLNKVTGG
jgi:hypothetical protein